MTEQEAINRLYSKYKRHGITKKNLRDILYDIENQCFEFKDNYNFLRMTLAKEYGEEELFTIDECARLTGQSKAQVLKTVKKNHTNVVSGFLVFLPNGLSDL